MDTIREMVDRELMRQIVENYAKAEGYIWTKERTDRVIEDLLRRGGGLFDCIEDEVILYGTGIAEDDQPALKIKAILERGGAWKSDQ
jgi:hypothetical protein